VSFPGGLHCERYRPYPTLALRTVALSCAPCVACRVRAWDAVYVSISPAGETLAEPNRRRYRERSAISRTLSGLDRGASHPLLALIVLTGSAAWLIFSAIVGFPSRPERIFQTLVGGVTLAMVFVIQHTQARQQSATQRKLDEILQALPEADNALLTIEEASDSELRATGDSHQAIRKAALEDDNQHAEPTQPDPD
jgi:low affinity Fe/Cu permease